MFKLLEKFGLSGYYKDNLPNKNDNINEICLDFTMNLMAKSGLSVMRANTFYEKIIRWTAVICVLILCALSIVGLCYPAPIMHYLKLFQTIGTALQILIKLNVVRIYKLDFIRLRNDTSKFWKIEDLQPLDREKYQFIYKIINRIVQLFVIIGTILVFLYHLKPFFGKLAFYTWKPEDSTLGFWIISIVGLLTVDCMMFFVIGFDCTFVVLCINARNQFDLLAKKFSNLDYGNENIDQIISDLIRYHTFLLRHVNHVNKTFSAFFLVQYTLISFALCSHVGALSMRSNINMVETSEILMYLIVVFYQFTLYCIALDEVAKQADILHDAVFHSKWYEHHGTFKGKLYFIIMRCRKGSNFTAGGMVRMDRTLIITVFRMCMSVWAMINTLTNI